MSQDTPAYLVPAGVHRVEETIRRSRFITTGGHAPTSEEAHAFVARIREEFPDATHNCWAFVAGPPGDTASMGMSDDGEPHGTAGRPMLQTLLHSDVGEIVVVSTRYFGGTKLGTGGLSRAYGGGAKLLLETLPLVEKVRRTRLLVVVDYETVDPLKRLLEEVGGRLLEEEYTGEVRYRVAVPTGEVEAFRKTLAGLTRGRASVEPEEG
jgi:uncharacterized YigZ family protein